MYPLGSCDEVQLAIKREGCANAGFQSASAEGEAQGALQVIYELQRHLAEIAGCPAFRQPAAGARK
jgi:glycine cleavage system protein P-like pyridoxal-binding family